MADNTEISWAHDTRNLWWGCQKVHAGCDHCLAPNTMVLKADFTWCRIDDLVIGDKLMAFNEKGKSLKRFEISTVERVWRTKGQAVSIKTPNTEIIASLNHRFLAGIARSRWVRSDQLSVNNSLRRLPHYELPLAKQDYYAGYLVGATLGDGTMRFEKPWVAIKHRDTPQRYWRIAVANNQPEFLERIVHYVAQLFDLNLHIKPFNSSNKQGMPMIRVECRQTEFLSLLRKLIDNPISTTSYMRGWLAGMFDAEGNFSKYRKNNGDIRVNPLRIAQVDTDVLKLGIDYAKDLGFEFVLESTRHVSAMRLVGGTKEVARFFMAIQPSILYKIHAITGSFVHYEKEPILSITKLPGERELIDIQTSSRTFIANGLLTHNCYAEVLDKRWGGIHWGAKAPRRIILSFFKDVMRSQRMAKEAGEIRRVFVGSMMDIFEVPKPLINIDGTPVMYGNNERQMTTGDLRSWFFNDIVPLCPDLLFLLLTKRPGNIGNMVPRQWLLEPPRNVMYGTSPVDAQTAMDMIPKLVKVPGRHFLSMEPLLGAIDLDKIMVQLQHPQNEGYGVPCLLGIDWVIAGGESGNGARPMHPDWVRKIRYDCREYGVPFHFKQWGEYLPACQGESAMPGLVTERAARPFPSPHNPKKMNTYYKIGKTAAGRLLDGILYNGMPK